jgi:putative nucleotidyltransferase with HDIG domain
MFSLMLISKNEREKQVLRQAFEQQQIKVLISEPDYPNFLNVMQYNPDAAIIELPRTCIDQLHFAGLIKKHKRTKSTPILGYGEPVDEGVKHGIANSGILLYFHRPLRFTAIMKVLLEIAKQRNKTLGVQPVQQAERDADFQKIMSTETLPQQKIDLMVKHVSKFMAFPFTVAKVMHLSDSDKSGAADLARVIEADPVISASILKVSNTVFFASLNRRISSIRDALVRIGFRETKRIVMSFAVMSLFGKDDKNLGFNRMDFWYHSLSTGIIAERLARHMGGLDSEEAFLAGLLHDFGIIILDEFFPQIFAQVMDKTTGSGAQFIDKETAMIGINHNDLVAELFRAWKMPEAIIDGVLLQYKAHELKDALDTPGKKIALCVAMGNILAKAAVLGRGCDCYVRPLDAWMFQVVKMARGFDAEFMEKLYRDIDLYRHFLKLEQQEFIKPSADNIETEKKRIGLSNLAADLFVPLRIYLEKEGFSVADVDLTEDLKTYDDKFDAVVLWTSAIDAKTLKGVAGLVRAGGAADPSKPPEFVRVFIVAPEGSPIAKQPAFENVPVLHQTGDLRQIEEAILKGAAVQTDVAPKKPA